MRVGTSVKLLMTLGVGVLAAFCVNYNITLEIFPRQLTEGIEDAILNDVSRFFQTQYSSGFERTPTNSIPFNDTPMADVGSLRRSNLTGPGRTPDTVTARHKNITKTTTSTVNVTVTENFAAFGRSESHSSLPRVLAIYFPQYHRDPLNDKNWGDNFTDWDSLRKSPEKNRKGYNIPRPTELGYYDLTDTDVRRRQGELANAYGIDGFIYHHYWFYDPSHPGPNLAVPLLRMLEDGHPNVPFFLNWCAVKWVNVWMGKPIFQKRRTTMNNAIVLQKQFVSPSDGMIQVHYNWLSKFFHHKNYIKIQNKPVFLLYYYDEKVVHILERLREFAKKDGFDGLYLIVGRSAPAEQIFVPFNMTEDELRVMKRKTQTLGHIKDLDTFDQSMTYPYPLQWLRKPYEVPQWCINGTKREVAAPQTRQEVTGIFTSFDNTPRREFKHSVIVGDGGPEQILARFEANLRTAIYYSTCCQEQTEDRFIAINAWNE